MVSWSGTNPDAMASLQRGIDQAARGEGVEVTVQKERLWVPFEAYHELVKELAAMKRDGFVPQHPYAEPEPPAKLPDVVRRALADLQADGPLLRHLQGQAWELLNAGVEEGEVAKRILEGEPAEY